MQDAEPAGPHDTGDLWVDTDEEGADLLMPRAFIGAPTTAPAGGDLAASQVSFSLNEAGNLLVVTVKYSDNTVKSGTLALV